MYWVKWKNTINSEEMKVIGLTGTMASGKETVRDIIEKNTNSHSVILSSLLKEDALKKQKITITREMRQNLGNELRKQYGADVLVKVAVGFMPRNKDFLIIDGLRNPGEVDFLKSKFGIDFKLIAVDAPQQVRFERISSRNREGDPKTWEEFVRVDDRDQGKDEPEYGQQVRKCIQMADILIQNDTNVDELNKKVADVIRQL